MKDFEKDRNYLILRAAYVALESEFDETNAPPEVAEAVYDVKELLDDVLRFYECEEGSNNEGN